MRARIKCLALDHDDTVVMSSPDIHYPSFVEAMRLLRETDSSIADIAAAVGYESQGKFTKAFKDVAQALPTEYRRQHRA